MDKNVGNKKTWIIIGVVVILLAVLGVGGFVLSRSSVDRGGDMLQLGQRYLDELNYEQAVVCYTAYLEIDPKSVKAYLGLAEAYIGLGQYESAINVLNEGIKQTGSEELANYLEKIQTEYQVPQDIEETAGPWEETVYFDDGRWIVNEYDSSGKRIKQTQYSPNGIIELISEFDTNEKCIKETWYNADGTASSYETFEHDSKGNTVKSTGYRADGTIVRIYEYNSYGIVKETWYNDDGTIHYYYIYEYDSNGNSVRLTWYNADDTIESYGIFEYDSNGNMVKSTEYNGDDTIEFYEIFEYDSDGNQVNSTRYNADGTLHD